MFDWRPDKMLGERGKHENVIIVKNLFEKETFDNDVSLLLEYQKDLREECSKCGAVKKVIVYDVSPKMIIIIGMFLTKCIFNYTVSLQKWSNLNLDF